MKYLIALVTFLLSSVALSNECASYGCTATIQDLYINASGNVYIKTAGDETKANCTLYAGGYLVLKRTAGNFDAVYTTLLSAYMADYKATVRIVESSADCEVAYVMLSKSN